MNRLELGDPMQHVIVNDSGCWIWQRAMLRGGYGRFGAQYAHRLYYELFTGETIPAGMHTDHLCRNKACCNPEHLEVVTPAENLRRGNRRGSKPKTHCKRGHEFTPESTYQYAVRRKCRTCALARRAVSA